MKTDNLSADDCPCDYLPWDSDFFGCRIGRVRGRLSPETTGRIVDWCGEERIDCLYLLSASDDPLTVALAEKHGFYLVDIRLTLERPLAPVQAQAIGKEQAIGKQEAVGKVRPARISDITVLSQTARESFRHSRFYFDPAFETSRCDDLYSVWIEQSVKGQADFVLVAELDGRPAGFITGHVKPGGIGEIGLLAVDAAGHGRGLGQQLVAESLRAFRESGETIARVVTQGRNIRAQRLYQRCGFITHSMELWYHKWLNRSEGHGSARVSGFA